MPIPLKSVKSALQAETEERAAAEEAAASQEQASADEDSSSGQSEDDEGQPGSNLKVPCYSPTTTFHSQCTCGHSCHVLAPAWQAPGDPPFGSCAACMPANLIAYPLSSKGFEEKTWCLHDRLKIAKMQRR